MHSKEALDKIKETEAKAQAIIEEAKDKARRLLHEASTKKELVISAVKDRISSDAHNLSKGIKEETGKEIALIESKAQEGIEVLKNKAQGNIGRAVEFLQKKVEI